MSDKLDKYHQKAIDDYNAAHPNEPQIKAIKHITGGYEVFWKDGTKTKFMVDKGKYSDQRIEFPPPKKGRPKPGLQYNY